MRSLIIVAALVALFPLTASAQSIEGVWERVDITYEGGPNPETVKEQGFVIFMDGHFSVLEVNTTEQRPLWDSSTTDAERLANFQSFVAGAGTYEMGDGTVTLRTTIAGVPNQVAGDPLVFQISFEGGVFTSVITQANGAKATRRYVRVE